MIAKTEGQIVTHLTHISSNFLGHESAVAQYGFSNIIQIKLVIGDQSLRSSDLRSEEAILFLFLFGENICSYHH